MKTNPNSQQMRKESTPLQINDDRTSGSRRGRPRNSLADFFSARIVAATTVAVLLGMLPATASATLFDSSVVISGSAQFDSLGSPSAPSGGASQGGTLSSIVGGVSTTTTLSGATITGTDPLAGTLTSIGDGFGIGFNASGGDDSGINNLFGDYLFTISNSSLIDTFIVNLKLDFNHQVDASGADAYAYSQIRLADAASTEFFYSGLFSDTVNGNRQYLSTDNLNNIGTGSGGAQTDGGSSILSFTLAPGASINLGDTSFEVYLQGGVAGTGSFSALATSLITVDSVVLSRQNPAAVPEPETLFLFGIGLALFRLAYRRR